MLAGGEAGDFDLQASAIGDGAVGGDGCAIHEVLLVEVGAEAALPCTAERHPHVAKSLACLILVAADAPLLPAALEGVFAVVVLVDVNAEVIGVGGGKR